MAATSCSTRCRCSIRSVDWRYTAAAGVLACGHSIIQVRCITGSFPDWCTIPTRRFASDRYIPQRWARYAHPYDFYAMRYIFAGAEKVREETERGCSRNGSACASWRLRCHRDSAGDRAEHGDALPAQHGRTVAAGDRAPDGDGPGIEGGGRLHVRGPNVMLGYILRRRNGVLHPPADGSYDTGDIVSIIDAGFVSIVGRAKRFAKIGGRWCR